MFTNISKSPRMPSHKSGERKHSCSLFHTGATHRSSKGNHTSTLMSGYYATMCSYSPAMPANELLHWSHLGLRQLQQSVSHGVMQIQLTLALEFFSETEPVKFKGLLLRCKLMGPLSHGDGLWGSLGTPLAELHARKCPWSAPASLPEVGFKQEQELLFPSTAPASI